MKSLLHGARGGVVAFLLVSLVFVCCPVKGVGDLFWSLPSVFSVLREGDLDLDEYREGFHHCPGAILEVDGHARNFFPLGPALVALPPIFVFHHGVRLAAPLAQPFPKVAAGVRNWQRNFARTGDIDPSFFFTTEMVLASLLMGLAAAFTFLTARERLPPAWALGVALVFGLCSAVWSTASRDLGQHGPSVLMLSVALWLLVRGERAPRGVALAGLFVGLAYVMRPTNSLSVLAFSTLVALRHRRQLPGFLACGLAVAAAFAAYNLSVYDAPLPPYYRPERVLPASGALLAEALAGNLVSPARGLFVYSPVFLLAGLGLWLDVRSPRWRSLAGVLGVLVVAHWLVVSSFPHWWGGHSYGPRYMTDMTPYLTWLLVPVLVRVREAWAAGRAPWRQPLAVGLALACAWSAFTHGRGATNWSAAHWNGGPVDVDLMPSRLWDWSDPPFLRGLH